MRSDPRVSTATTTTRRKRATAVPRCMRSRDFWNPDEEVGWEPVDSEGRYLRADFEGLSVISLYVPSGSSNDAAQARKDLFMEKFTPHMKALLEEDREFIICADWNTCHQNIDIKTGAATRKLRFMPHEREWLTHLYESRVGWTSFGK